jgi:arylsulfatase A-like enzyme
MATKPPDVLMILIDDMGFGASSAFGGPCQMPTAERLAGSGLTFTRFHSTGVCSPTRQSLLTGRNHHAVNMGTITDRATPVRGYSSVRPADCAPLAAVLSDAGYRTAAFGKWHQLPEWMHAPESASLRSWPTGEGFDEFYGFIGADSDHYSPTLFHGTQPVDPPNVPDYHLSTDLVDRTAEWFLRQGSLDPDAPRLAYLSFGATHAPHHAPPVFLERYRGRFDDGWDTHREATLERQKSLGVIPEDAELTTRPVEIPAWNDLTPAERRVASRLMEAYAAFAEHTDHQVGRLLDRLEAAGQLENTLVLYILGDNGGAQGGGRLGTTNENAALNGIHLSPDETLERLDQIGSATTYSEYPVGWAHAMNTPFQWTKIIASHLGATRQGLIVHWPAGIAKGGELRHQWHHVVDVAPTILELACVTPPAEFRGVFQRPLDGRSMAPSMAEDASEFLRPPQYFEVHGNRAVWFNGWWACAKHAVPWVSTEPTNFENDRWELYAPEDWSQARDLAEAHPEVLDQMKQLFEVEAERNHVHPLDSRRLERFLPSIAGRPTRFEGNVVHLDPSIDWLGEGAAPDVKNRSHRLIVELELPPRRGIPDGVVVAQGGRFGGWSLYLIEGRATYCYNYLDLRRHVVRGDRELHEGLSRVTVDFTSEGPGLGRGGEVRLLLDDVEIGRTSIPQTVPYRFSLSEGMSLRRDRGSAVSEDYSAPFPLASAVLRSVTFELDDATPLPAEASRLATETE